MKLKKSTYLILSLLVLIILINACQKEYTRVEPDTNPSNPYDGIDYGQNPNLIPIDSNSFLGLHQNIFSVSCAVPACHDGAFEPDFRSVTSAYNTMVYANVKKNNPTNDFTFRVIPGDTSMSWLHERVTTDDAILGRMPLYDNELHPNLLENLETWILDGAKDIYGNFPDLPNYQPSFFGVLAYINDSAGYRLDTIRDNVVAPIKLPQNTTVQLWIGLYDIDTNGDFIPAFGLTYNKYLISDHLYDFNGQTEENLTVQGPFDPFYGPIPFQATGTAPYYHSFKINTNDFLVNKTYYFRSRVQDSNHSFPTEIPNEGSPTYLLTYFSFIVE